MRRSVRIESTTFSLASVLRQLQNIFVSTLYNNSKMNRVYACALLCDVNRCHFLLLSVILMHFIVCGRRSAFSWPSFKSSVCSWQRRIARMGARRLRWCRLRPTSMILARRLYGPTTVKVGQLVVGMRLSPRVKGQTCAPSTLTPRPLAQIVQWL